MDSTTLKAYTLVPDNYTYLSCMKACPTPPAPMNSGTLGLLMLLSTLQYQAPYMGPYSNAASQAGKAAFIQSGGQQIQDRFSAKLESQAKEAVHSVGITDTQAGVVLGAAKIARDKQVDVNGPKIFFVHTHLTVGQDHANVGLGFSF